MFGAYLILSHQDQKSSCSDPLKFYPLFEISLPKNQVLMDTFVEDLNNDNQADFIATTLNSEKNKAGVTLIYMSQVSQTPKALVLEGPFKHPRNIQFFDINNDAFLDLLISDHGFDETPFNGGQSQIYLNQRGESFTQLKSFQPQKAFSFNLLPIFQIKQSYTVLLNQNIPGPGPESETLKLDPSLNTKLIQTPWPEDIKEKCFMSGVHLQSSVIIGACDRDQNMSPTPADLEIQWNPQTSKFEVLSKLPKRFQNTHWGSVSFATDSETGKLLLRSTHNFGYSKGAVELLKKEEKNWKSIWGKISHYQLEGFYSNVSFSEPSKYFAISFRDKNKESLTKSAPRQQVFAIRESGKIEEICMPPEFELNPGQLTLYKKNAFLIKNGNQIYFAKLD